MARSSSLYTALRITILLDKQLVIDSSFLGWNKYEASGFSQYIVVGNSVVLMFDDKMDEDKVPWMRKVRCSDSSLMALEIDVRSSNISISSIHRFFRVRIRPIILSILLT